MNINNLVVGETYKSYRAMCEVLEEKVKSGNSKKAQIKEWERYFKYHKDGNKFIIDEIYKEIKEKIDHRGGSFNKLYFDSFKPECHQWNYIGVYKIVLHNDIYIGSTTVGFRKRFLSHKNKNYNNLHTYDMLQNGATFEIVEIMNGCEEPTIRQRENKYIQLYNDMNEYNVINSNDAWSYTTPKERYKTIKLKVNEVEYNNVINILKDNDLLKYFIDKRYKVNRCDYIKDNEFKRYSKIYNMIYKEMITQYPDGDLNVIDTISDLTTNAIEDLIDYEKTSLEDINIKEEIDKTFDIYISSLESECNFIE